MAINSERIQQLEDVEKEIAHALQTAGQALTELSKDKPTMKGVEQNLQNFLKTVDSIETNLSKHIGYLTQISTGNVHEGSCYSAHRDLRLANDRHEHVRARIDKLLAHSMAQK